MEDRLDTKRERKTEQVGQKCRGLPLLQATLIALQKNNVKCVCGYRWLISPPASPSLISAHTFSIQTTVGDFL